MATNRLVSPAHVPVFGACRSGDLLYLVLVSAIALAAAMIWMERHPMTGTWKRSSIKSERSLFTAPAFVWSPSTVDKRLATLPASPNRTHLLGTDDRGRDILSRLVHSLIRDFSFSLVALAAVLGVSFVLGGVPCYFALPYIRPLLTEKQQAANRVLLSVGEFLRPVCRALPIFFLAAALAETGFRNHMALLLIWICFCWGPIAQQIAGWIRQWSVQSHVQALAVSGIQVRRIFRRHLAPYLIPRICALAPRLVMESIGIVCAFQFLGLGSNSHPSLAEFFKQFQTHPNAWWILLPALVVLVGIYLGLIRAARLSDFFLLKHAARKNDLAARFQELPQQVAGQWRRNGA
jgi:ABC-type dipeptide/oligopeptide/nickel transport system permease subunit